MNVWMYIEGQVLTTIYMYTYTPGTWLTYNEQQAYLRERQTVEDFELASEVEQVFTDWITVQRSGNLRNNYGGYNHLHPHPPQILRGTVPSCHPKSPPLIALRVTPASKSFWYCVNACHTPVSWAYKEKG